MRDRRALPLQVRDEIIRLVGEQGLGPGDRLPSELEIGVRFGVGRTTVREALKLLEQDGAIEVRHGHGRFVSPLWTLQRPINRLESVTEMMAELGVELTTRVLDVTVRQATEEERDALSLDEGELVLRIRRVRYQRQEPVIYSIDVLPASLAPDMRDPAVWAGSLFQWLEGSGHRIQAATAQMRATMLPDAVASQARLPASEPWLLLVHRNIDTEGRPLVYSHDYYRGDRFTFNVFRRRERPSPVPDEASRRTKAASAAPSTTVSAAHQNRALPPKDA